MGELEETNELKLDFTKLEKLNDLSRSFCRLLRKC